MSARLCLVGCHNFHAEVRAALAAEKWDDVLAVEFPSRCGRPPVDWDELHRLLPPDCAQVIVMGRACLGALDAPPAGWPPVRLDVVRQCFHLVAGESLVDESIAGGGYLVTPAWLADWRGQLKALGFEAAQAGEFFREFARELVLLDTGVDPEAPARFAELRQALGLPGRRVPVGLDAARARLARVVLDWRRERAEAALKDEVRRHAGELADHVAAMDMLARLAEAGQEDQAIEGIEELFRSLFAPTSLHYLRESQGVSIARGDVPDAMAEAMRALEGRHGWTADGQGFLLRIAHGGETVGRVAVDRVAFPAYRERYLNLALALAEVCGLAIENARNRRRLVEAGKMASLGVLVAGVAHEINTPLGVGLAAASTLEAQSRRLAGQFASRTMTQSDLSRHLDAAQAGSGLLVKNLERIGQLVEAFRQVALEGRPQDRQPVRLRECLEEVLRSLGGRWVRERFPVRIDCPDEVVIEGVAGDWASIFANLVANSLLHGFKGRERGAIDVRIGREGRTARVDYRDDGVGLAPEALARLFDPFFTTDPQHGMGLGMHRVYNLVTHAMGGRIHCESRPGDGFHIRIELPT